MRQQYTKAQIRKIAELRRAGHSPTQIEAILFEDAHWARGFQRGSSQRAWNAVACATAKRVRNSRV